MKVLLQRICVLCLVLIVALVSFAVSAMAVNRSPGHGGGLVPPYSRPESSQPSASEPESSQPVIIWPEPEQMPRTPAKDGSGAWQTLIDGSVQFYQTNGTLTTGWSKIDGNWYYFNSSGIRQRDWLKDGGKWYFLSSDGVMVTGWIKQGGKWYYLLPSGEMATGTHNISGNLHHLSAAGTTQGPKSPLTGDNRMGVVAPATVALCAVGGCLLARKRTFAE